MKSNIGEVSFTLCFLSNDCTLASSRPISSLDTKRKVSNIHVSTSSASAKNYNIDKYVCNLTGRFHGWDEIRFC